MQRDFQDFSGTLKHSSGDYMIVRGGSIIDRVGKAHPRYSEVSASYEDETLAAVEPAIQPSEEMSPFVDPLLGPQREYASSSNDPIEPNFEAIARGSVQRQGWYDANGWDQSRRLERNEKPPTANERLKSRLAANQQLEGIGYGTYQKGMEAALRDPRFSDNPTTNSQSKAKGDKVVTNASQGKMQHIGSMIVEAR